MKVKIIGYRNWAERLYDRVTDTIGWDGKSKQEIEFSRAFENQPYQYDRFDVLFFVGWSNLIPEYVYTSVPCIVLHPSPLPRYRGGSPLQHQIIQGETISAVTLFRLDPGFPWVDAGPICWQAPYSLSGSLSDILDRVVQVGAEGISYVIRNWPVEFMPQMIDGTNPPLKRRTPEESEIKHLDFVLKPASALHNKIRALQDPYPLPFIVCGDGRKLYILETWLDEDGGLASESGQSGQTRVDDPDPGRTLNDY